MSNLISGKEVALAILDGKELLWRKMDWNMDELEPVSKSMWNIEELVSGKTISGDLVEFYLKPRTITLNGIELNKCYSLGIDRIKNEVSIQFKDESDADDLHDLLSRLYGFKG